MAKSRVKRSIVIKTAPRPRGQSGQTGKVSKPVARWVTEQNRRLLVLENAYFRVALWPKMGGAITSYIDRATGVDIIWRNPYGQPPRARPLDQPMQNGSDLYDVMDGSWYVSLPTGFFACDYFGAPIGTHGELRSLPWKVEEIHHGPASLRVLLVGQSVRTPLVYRRELTFRRDSTRLHWRETVANRSGLALPVAWLQHPTFGGPLLDGARLLTPAKSVQVVRADDPTALQLKSGYRGHWPFVPERVGGRLRDCSLVPAAGSGLDHSVQLTDFPAGWGCIWNERRGLGFALEWDAKLFPYAWSWNSSGGIAHYPLWGEGHIITLQPSTSPVARFTELVRRGELLQVPAHGEITTRMTTGFVDTAQGPWSEPEERP
jgi:hypothetical protein